jgi:4'-phosphopantetheinyl transferase EntD
MIEGLLPPGSASAEARGGAGALFPAEAALVATATAKRRAEFAGGRACAHEALRALGLAPSPVLGGGRGEPLWPAGVVGSIAHCDGYRGCAVARASEWLALAIDAEPHVPVSARLLDRLARPAERRRLAKLARSHPAIHWGKLLFSAKECAYKALSPATAGSPPIAGFELEIDPERGTFGARPPAGGLGLGEAVEGLDGRWLVRDGLVLTAIAVPARAGRDQAGWTGKPAATDSIAQSAPVSSSAATA